MADLSILMPVLNERLTVRAAVEDALSIDPLEVVVVDNGSTDGSTEVLPADPRVIVLRETATRGKGAAVRAGLARARGAYCAILDADLEYRAADIPLLLAPLLAGEADAAFGTRGFEHSYSRLYVLGNRGVTLTANLLYGARLTDVMTCHKVARTELLRSLPLRADGFSIETEIAAGLLARGCEIAELPVEYRARSRAEGKKLRAIDGARAVWTLARRRRRRQAVAAPVPRPAEERVG